MKKIKFAALLLTIVLGGLSSNSVNFTQNNEDNAINYVDQKSAVLSAEKNALSPDEATLQDVAEEYLSGKTSRFEYGSGGAFSGSLTLKWDESRRSTFYESETKPIFVVGDQSGNFSIDFTFRNRQTGEAVNETTSVQLDASNLENGANTLTEDSEQVTIQFTTTFSENLLIDTYTINGIYANVGTGTVLVEEVETESFVILDSTDYTNSFYIEVQEYLDAISEDDVASIISTQINQTAITNYSYYYTLIFSYDADYAYSLDENLQDKVIYTIGYYGSSEDYYGKIKVTLNDGGEYYGNIARQTGVSTVATLGVNYAASINSNATVELPYGTTNDDIAKVEVTNVFLVNEVHNGSVYLTEPRLYDPITIEIENIRQRRYVFSDLVSDFHATSMTKFDSQYMLNMTLSVDIEPSYLSFVDAGYIANYTKEDIIENVEAGAYGYRVYFGFTSFNESRLEGSYFRITYKDGSIAYNGASTSVSSHEFVNGVNSIAFFFNEIDIANVQTIDMYGITLRYELYNIGSDSAVVNSGVEFKFGYLATLYGDGIDVTGAVVEDSAIPEVGSYINLNLIFILTFIGFAVLFTIGAVILFIYRSRKYKDDEFKHVVPKKFWKTYAIALVCLYALIGDLEIIYFRMNLFNNSAALTNYMDIIIFVYTIVGALLVGYFIRRFYIAIKDYREKVRRERLNIGVNEEDSSGVGLVASHVGETSSSHKVEESKVEKEEEKIADSAVVEAEEENIIKKEDE